MARRSITARFLDKTWKRADSSCWPWMAFIDDNGYGRFWVNQTLGSVPAHRVSFLLFEPDAAVEVGEKILTCPVLKSCVNPRHIGKAADADIGDRILWVKGLKRALENDGVQVVLTHQQICDIYVSDKPNKKLAEEYGILPLRVALIRSGKWYRKVTQDL